MFVGFGSRFESGSQSLAAQCLADTGGTVVGRDSDEKPVSPVSIDDECLNVSNSYKGTFLRSGKAVSASNTLREISIKQANICISICYSPVDDE